MSKEAALESKVRAYCKKHGVEFWKFVSPGRKGVPDRLLIGPLGKMAFIEFKSPTGKPSALQLREMANLNRRRVPHLLTSDYEEARAMVRSLLPNYRSDIDHSYPETKRKRPKIYRGLEKFLRRVRQSQDI